MESVEGNCTDSCPQHNGTEIFTGKFVVACLISFYYEISEMTNELSGLKLNHFAGILNNFQLNY